MPSQLRYSKNSVRHAHQGILISGVVSHATELVEHPELIANRIITFAELVGRENVVADTDWAWVAPQPQIAWAELRALRDGAAIASKMLWS